MSLLTGISSAAESITELQAERKKRLAPGRKTWYHCRKKYRAQRRGYRRQEEISQLSSSITSGTLHEASSATSSDQRRMTVTSSKNVPPVTQSNQCLWKAINPGFGNARVSPESWRCQVAACTQHLASVNYVLSLVLVLSRPLLD